MPGELYKYVSISGSHARPLGVVVVVGVVVAIDVVVGAAVVAGGAAVVVVVGSGLLNETASLSGTSTVWVHAVLT